MLKRDLVGPCPKCGEVKRTFEMKGSGGLSFGGSAKWQHVRISWEGQPLLLALVIVVCFVSPFLGFFLAQWPGFWVGLVLSMFGFVGGIYAITKVKSITTGGDRTLERTVNNRGRTVRAVGLCARACKMAFVAAQQVR